MGRPCQALLIPGAGPAWLTWHTVCRFCPTVQQSVVNSETREAGRTGKRELFAGGDKGSGCFTNPSCLCKCKITALKIKYNPFAKAFLDAKER